MRLDEDAARLRIYMGENDRVAGKAAHRVVLELLRQRGVWGATVVRGLSGFGRTSVMHSASPLRLSTDLPVVIEAVDALDKLEGLVEEVSDMIEGGLITIEPVRVVRHVGGDEEE